ncbi:MAG: hypothetical protein AAGC68_10515 [Verrucomicrobiota bacterium]
MEVILLQSAQTDLLEIYSRFGESSYRQIDQSLESIRRMPFIAPIFHSSIRRKLVSGTPYGVFYSVEGSRIMVGSVLDLRQNPEAILRKLQP